MFNQNITKRKNILFLLVNLFLLVTLPSVGLCYFKFNSMAPGLLVAMLILFFGHIPRSKNDYRISLMIVIPFILIIGSHFLLVEILNDEHNKPDKFWYSLIAFSFLLISANNLTSYICNIGNEAIDKVASILYLILSVEAFLAIFNFAEILSSAHIKPLIFYSEPSHFSLVFLPFFYYKIFSDKKNRYLHLLNGLLISFFLKSAVLLVGIIIILPIVFNFFKSILIFISTLISLTFFQYQYFLDRISLTDQSTNTSVLVFMSAYERATLNFGNTKYLGLGFQQLGENSTFGKYQELLIQNHFEMLNIEDAGVMFSKLISELGLIGIFLILFYFLILYRSLKILKYNQNNYIYQFFFAVLFSSLIEIFLRGLGYFSPGIFFLCSAIIYFHYYEKKDSVF
jgi:hypothetical protein